MEEIRINKFLSQAGVCSRRQADSLIEKKKVLINSRPAINGQKINSSIDEIVIDGKKVNKQSVDRVYYALYKPLGVLSTASDELGRKSVVDLVPSIPRVFPVGRLDSDSEGLILLTDDGELANLLTHPKYNHQKTYEVKAVSSGEIDKDNLAKELEKGVHINGKIMKADMVEVEFINPKKRLLKLVLTLHTGYNRQIRKMCGKIGLEVLGLRRVSIAKLDLKRLNLSPGQFKVISKDEII